MFCPKCGDVLERRSDGELACERGDMGLSRSLERRLSECFIENVRRPSDVPFPSMVGGAWVYEA